MAPFHCQASSQYPVKRETSGGWKWHPSTLSHLKPLHTHTHPPTTPDPPTINLLLRQSCPVGDPDLQTPLWKPQDKLVPAFSSSLLPRVLSVDLDAKMCPTQGLGAQLFSRGPGQLCVHPAPSLPHLRDQTLTV